MTPKKRIDSLNAVVAKAAAHFHPPDDITVSEWADRYRVLPESSAEPGPWRTERTPYLKEPMDAFTDPKVHRIVVVASSQVGKTELELNILGYIIHEDPANVLFVLPSDKDGEKMSRLRIAPMIRSCRVLRERIAKAKGRDSSNTLMQKSFAGGSLTMVGTNKPSDLASIPCRYIIGDERDRWAWKSGDEGDPWALAEARQTTFFNAKSVEVSTPTIKGKSAIEKSYYQGTQERWCHQCPECGTWHEITFDGLKYDFETVEKHGKKNYKVQVHGWMCPDCCCVSSEQVMRRQPTRWIANNPDAYENGIRSFWLNAFSSPWSKMAWVNIVRDFLNAKDDPQRLQTVKNTKLGELWEDRGEVESEDELLARREDYGVREDGTPVELPEGVLVLTCGVDNQNDRLEYEVVGHGRGDEKWGIKKGVLWGRPDDPATWAQLDTVIDHTYRFANGVGLDISVTFVDSGGQFTQDVYLACKARAGKRVFAVKGKSGDGIPYVGVPSRVKIVVKQKVVGHCWLYMIGVDSGKEKIMSALKVQTPGPRYCHFPKGEEQGYDWNYFNGLTSEKLTRIEGKRGDRWGWERLTGHPHNEALDCRNYANAAFRRMDVDLDEVERRLKGLPEKKRTPPPPKKAAGPRQDFYDEW